MIALLTACLFFEILVHVRNIASAKARAKLCSATLNGKLTFYERGKAACFANFIQQSEGLPVVWSVFVGNSSGIFQQQTMTFGFVWSGKHDGFGIPGRSSTFLCLRNVNFTGIRSYVGLRFRAQRLRALIQSRVCVYPFQHGEPP